MIKFRAWDKNTNDMVSVKTIDLERDGSIGCRVDYSGINLDVSECVLMQSTGLQDKNGVEIFEGDVVLADGVQVTVSFGEQKHEENYGDETYYIGFNVYTKMGYGMLIPVKYEVLGNIYANPELLSNP